MNRLDHAIEAMKRIKVEPTSPAPDDELRIYSWPRNGRNKKRKPDTNEDGHAIQP